MCSCAIFITFLADTLGRRWSFIWTGYAMFIFMFYLGFYVRFDPPTEGPVSSAGRAALVMVYLFAAAFQFGWGPVCWIYISEIPTNRLRGYTVSLGAATQWLFNLVVTRVTPLMLKNVGANGYGTYFIYGCFCFTMATAAFWIPETKGVSVHMPRFHTPVVMFANVSSKTALPRAYGRALRGGRLLRRRGHRHGCRAC